VYYNAGAVFARLFQMEEACECMKKAFDLLQTSAARNGYLFCVRMKDGEEAFQRKCEELGVGERGPGGDGASDPVSSGGRLCAEDVDAALNLWGAGVSQADGSVKGGSSDGIKHLQGGGTGK
jgi:hypothetical protein